MFSFTLSSLKNRSRVWCFAADSHLRLLDRNLKATRFHFSGLSFELWHRRSVSFFVHAFKISYNPKHFYSYLPSLFRPAQLQEMFLVLTALPLLL